MLYQGVAATPALEAAARILRNHEAIAKDAVRGCAGSSVLPMGPQDPPVRVASHLSHINP